MISLHKYNWAALLAVLVAMTMSVEAVRPWFPKEYTMNMRESNRGAGERVLPVSVQSTNGVDFFYTSDCMPRGLGGSAYSERTDARLSTNATEYRPYPDNGSWDEPTDCVVENFSEKNVTVESRVLSQGLQQRVLEADSTKGAWAGGVVRV